MGIGRGTNLGAAHWRRVLEEWRASGLSQAEFCRQRGIHPATFSGRKRRLALWLADVGPSESAPSIHSKPGSAEEALAAVAFVEARIADVAVGLVAGDALRGSVEADTRTPDQASALRRGAGIEIVFGESLGVRVDVGFDEDALHAVLRVLARSP